VGGASKGLGWGCARALALEGVNVVMVVRGAEVLNQSVADLKKEAPGVTLIGVAADITTEAGRAALFSVSGGPGKDFDIVVTNAGGPPPGDFRNWEREQWIAAVDANMLTPIELIRATVDGMMERGFGRIINITSSAVKAPIDILGLSNGARAGLTGFIAGFSRTTVHKNVTINNLLPGPFETDRLWATFEGAAKSTGKDLDSLVSARRDSNPAKRFGKPAEFGAFCAFLCSTHASYMTGQNILLDGGAYPGTF
jgi:3-oxoacyl-[acyl-carrier protein] reductase